MSQASQLNIRLDEKDKSRAIGLNQTKMLNSEVISVTHQVISEGYTNY